jgi:hypothetical protein
LYEHRKNVVLPFLFTADLLCYHNKMTHHKVFGSTKINVVSINLNRKNEVSLIIISLLTVFF